MKKQCSHCSGSGYIKKEIIKCNICNGKKCIECKGTGLKQQPYETCLHCYGLGEVQIEIIQNNIHIKFV